MITNWLSISLLSPEHTEVVLGMGGGSFSSQLNFQDKSATSKRDTLSTLQVSLQIKPSQCGTLQAVCMKLHAFPQDSGPGWGSWVRLQGFAASSTVQCAYLACICTYQHSEADMENIRQVLRHDACHIIDINSGPRSPISIETCSHCTSDNVCPVLKTSSTYYLLRYITIKSA